MAFNSFHYASGYDGNFFGIDGALYDENPELFVNGEEIIINANGIPYTYNIDYVTGSNDSETGNEHNNVRYIYINGSGYLDGWNLNIGDSYFIGVLDGYCDCYGNVVNDCGVCGENCNNNVGNINLNPLFNDSEHGDYTLQYDSPCIDTGIADLDDDGVDDITDFIGSAPDMGAFEFIGASMSGDLNGDDIINVIDIITLVNMVVAGDPYDSEADLNSDGIINILDIITLVNIVLEA